ncbi:MAG: hypothetical protein Q3M24_22540 [Candidatus Electrothrix aestuarii]|uniref:Trypsin-like peptidase domain-containing protein n=1 Tax=Candidatus Electrothrix aestuarii TaxID=3062594 RepID=A0AAU8LVU7_9BACT|nr:hypothetical protein [Candidatus Electrothrix aestuarii]
MGSDNLDRIEKSSDERISSEQLTTKGFIITPSHVLTCSHLLHTKDNRTISIEDLQYEEDITEKFKSENCVIFAVNDFPRDFVVHFSGHQRTDSSGISSDKFCIDLNDELSTDLDNEYKIALEALADIKEEFVSKASESFFRNIAIDQKFNLLSKELEKMLMEDKS